MKFVKWKILIITSIVCLAPILFGLSLWNELPDVMAIHFNINNQPDNFASKGFVVFALPLILLAGQVFSCVIVDINAHKKGESVKFERVTKWIIPVMSIVLQIATLGFSLGWDVDIRKVAVFLVGAIFVLTGNYMPKLDYIKNYKIDKEKAKKINRFLGFETVVMGLLFWISIFLPPVYSVVVLILMIPYTIIGLCYGLAVTKKEK